MQYHVTYYVESKCKLMIDTDAADAEALSAIVDAAQAVCTSYEKDCRIVR